MDIEYPRTPIERQLKVENKDTKQKLHEGKKE